eukprot:642367-Rhodomonas_salina.5
MGCLSLQALLSSSCSLSNFEVVEMNAFAAMELTTSGTRCGLHLALGLVNHRERSPMYTPAGRLRADLGESLLQAANGAGLDANLLLQTGLHCIGLHCLRDSDWRSNQILATHDTSGFNASELNELVVHLLPSFPVNCVQHSHACNDGSLNTGGHIVEEVSKSSEILLEGQQETLHVLISLVHGQNSGIVGLSKKAGNVRDKVPADSFSHPLVEEKDPAKDLDTDPKPRAGFPSRNVERSIQQILDAMREENASQMLLLSKSVVALGFEPGLLKH